MVKHNFFLLNVKAGSRKLATKTGQCLAHEPICVEDFFESDIFVWFSDSPKLRVDDCVLVRIMNNENKILSEFYYEEVT